MKYKSISLEEQPLFELPQLIMFCILLFSFFLGLSLLVVPWYLVVSIFLVMVTTAAIFLNLYVALIIFLIGAFFHPTYHFPMLQGLHIARNMSLFIIIIWAGHSMVYRDLKFPKDVQHLYIAGFLVFVFLACFKYFDVSFSYFTEFGTKAIVLYFAIICLLNTRGRVINFVSFLILFSTISALIGIYQYINHIGLYYAQEGILRISGPDEDANIFATNLTLSVPIVINVFMGTKRKVIRSVLFSVLTVLVLTIILTFSRAGMIQLVAGLWLTIGIRMIKKYKALGVIVFLVLFMFMLPFVPSKYFDRMGTILNFQDQAIAARLEGWRLGTTMIADHPIRGIGFAIFRFEFLKRSVTGIDTHFKRALDAHNVFIHTGAEVGLIGLGFLLLLIRQSFINLKYARDKLKRQGDILLSNIADGLRIGLLIYLIGGIFISYLELLIFWIIIPTSVVLKHLSDKLENQQCPEI
ncbi:MAG: O-antigen ligase family protein [Candidatus Omnitrophota bacterium]